MATDRTVMTSMPARPAVAIPSPSCPLSGSAMPIAPPTTHDSCSSVSDRANAEVRTASATSRWMIASSDSLPSDCARPAANATARTV